MFVLLSLWLWFWNLEIFLDMALYLYVISFNYIIKNRGNYNQPTWTDGDGGLAIPINGGHSKLNFNSQFSSFHRSSQELIAWFRVTGLSGIKKVPLLIAIWQTAFTYLGQDLFLWAPQKHMGEHFDLGQLMEV